MEDTGRMQKHVTCWNMDVLQTALQSLKAAQGMFGNGSVICFCKLWKSTMGNGSTGKKRPELNKWKSVSESPFYQSRAPTANLAIYQD